ncbi:TraY domain-containing protein [Vibrio harveyi]|uniref:TraY domain-containing protein n=1 Tax=Vibrio harveyi TaxID=669 RepID=UPI0024812229|nr:TraY domain-containing protein [Vibrio harveyi]
MDNKELIEGKLTLDQQAYDLLNQASLRSFRSLKKEASLRLIDHVQRFHHSPQNKLDKIVFKTSIKIPIKVRKSVVPREIQGENLG